MGRSVVMWISGLLIVGALYTNCQGGHMNVSSSGSFQLGDPSNINNYKEYPPAVICGSAGYDFLLRNYLRANCGSCHGAGGIAFPQFTDSNLQNAYWAAQLVARDKWVTTTTNNQFCGPDCNLSTSGQVYKGLMEWLDHKTSCP